ncbi:MAG TPA: DEAD/DEAH box helicase [Rectinemataceae bacterium]|nr:DEAD/DEAH box helicase [Rectinemataceae bacterium]
MRYRGEYGVTSWGRLFVGAIGGFVPYEVLSRGRSYANTGKVVELAVDSAVVTAKVLGRSRPWYRVKIAFPPLKERDRAALDDIIEADPLLLARIESGELPTEVLDRLKARDVALVPTTWKSMKRSCSCPDSDDPCRHMAAVYYMLAREIDRDPRFFFKLRGLDLAEVYGRAPEPEIPEPFSLRLRAMPADLAGMGKKAAADAFAAAIRAAAAAEPSPEPPRFENYVKLALSLLPPAPPFASGDFTIVLAEFYHRAMRELAGEGRVGAEREARDEPGPERGPKPDVEPKKETSELEYASARYSVVDSRVSLAGRELSFMTSGYGSSLIARFPNGNMEKLDLLDASRLFLGFSGESGGPGYRFFFHFFRHMRALLRAGAFCPAIVVVDSRDLSLVWRPLPLAKDVDRALDDLARIEPGLCEPTIPWGRKPARGLVAALLEGRTAVDLLAAGYLNAWVHALGFRPEGLSLDQRDIADLFFAGRPLRIDRPATAGLPAAIQLWLSVLSIDFGAYRYRFTIEGKSGPETDGEDEGRRDEGERGGGAEDGGAFAMRLEVLLAAKPGEIAGGLSARALPLGLAARKSGDRGVLRVPAALSAYLPELRSLTERRSIVLEEKRLAAFLSEAAPLLSRLGAEVVLPKDLRRALSPRLVLRARAKAGGSLRSYLDLDSMLQYDWRIAIGDELVDIETFRRLVESGKSLVRFRDGFVKIDPEEAARIFDAARSRRRMGSLDLVSARLAGETLFSAEAEELVASLFRERETPPPASLAAVLRPYQERGYRWICSNFHNGFGCVLADDMGLGKTVQAIAVMLRLQEEGLAGDGILVVAPAALLTNWERELARFAPGLAAARYHGQGRSLDGAAQVLLTTYQTAVRDLDKLEKRPFSLLVADEAHLLKNAQTRQSRAIKSLAAARRLALSGTPVENRLEDLRSLFDFALPGYLGGAAEFRKAWRVPIEVERDRNKAELLKRITAPFLMRRLKTDPAIVDDLPAKVSIDEYANLTTEQAALYQSIVEKNLDEVSSLGPGAERSAIVLRLITALKQVCDHPRVYDKESPPVAALSGKCALLLSILEEVLEGEEKVLVFSQYVETLELLRAVILAELGVEALLYHGGMGEEERDAAVDEFQGSPARRVMLVSLKAGGLGLNLTAASRVIHYDLWFNPAVENQATDRAFRIGQTRKVFVHRFVTTGTFEEKIDAMLRAKRELAEMSVAAGESWLARMGDEELRSIFLR